MDSPRGCTSPRSRRPRYTSAGQHSGPSTRRGHRRGPHGHYTDVTRTWVPLVLNDTRRRQLAQVPPAPDSPLNGMLMDAFLDHRLGEAARASGTLPVPPGTTEIIMEMKQTRVTQPTSWSVVVSDVVAAMDLICPDGSPAFIGSHNQPGDEPL